MTIREMEDATGLTRANIRFYENQGLIQPERKENNYREYASEDAEILLRVKLLRALGMSIEQIRLLQSGQENLIAALDRQIRELEREQQRLGNSQRVCREMRSDNVSYETLDARRYLNSLDNPPAKPSVIVARDVEPPVFAPWQRYWARWLDSWINSCLLILIATWLSDGALPQWGTLVSTVLGIAMSLILEPLQLRLFGTTLGKWIFGIRVTDMDGRRLSLSEGFWRTAIVLWYGEGLGIPIVNLWRLYKSYKQYEANEFLPWDDPSELTVKDKSPWRYLAAFGAAAAAIGLMMGCVRQLQLPEHRDALTPAQFCENYRKLARQYSLDDERYQLRDDGTWIEVEQPGTVYIDLSPNSVPLDFVFTTENGIVTSVTISEELEGEQEGWISSRSGQMQIMSLAILRAQEEYRVLAKDDEPVLTKIVERPFEDFSVTVCGLEFRYDAELSGYWTASGGFLVDDDDPDTEPAYSMTYTVKTAE